MVAGYRCENFCCTHLEGRSRSFFIPALIIIIIFILTMTTLSNINNQSWEKLINPSTKIFPKHITNKPQLHNLKFQFIMFEPKNIVQGALACLFDICLKYCWLNGLLLAIFCHSFPFCSFLSCNSCEYCSRNQVPGP